MSFVNRDALVSRSGRERLTRTGLTISKALATVSLGGLQEACQALVVSPTMTTGHRDKRAVETVSGGRCTFHVHQDSLRNRLAGEDG